MKNLLTLLSTNQRQHLLALLVPGPDLVSHSLLEGFVNYVNDAGCTMLGPDSKEEAKPANRKIRRLL